MSHIDTLKTYEDLMASGVPSEQAKSHVHALNSSFDGVATKDDLNNLRSDFTKDLTNMADRLESHLKIFFVYTIFGGIALTIIFPIILQLILKQFGWS